MPHYAVMHNVLYEYSPRPSYFLPDEGVVPVSVDAEAPALPDAEAPAVPGIVEDPDKPPDIVLSADGASIADEDAARLLESKRPANLFIDQSQTPWFRRHSSFFDGQILPFGCGVYFKPAPTKYDISKAAPRMNFGVFLGYRLHPGGKWNGEYYVADLDDFAGKSLHEAASHFEWPAFKPHVTKNARLPKEGVFYPLKKRYQRDNCTPEGREDWLKTFEKQVPGGDEGDEKKEEPPPDGDGDAFDLFND